MTNPEHEHERKPVMTADERYVPHEIRNETLWVIWDFREKQPLAPWKTGHCYPTKWNANLPTDERPEIDYEEARKWANLPPRELDRSHPFPRTDEEDNPIPNRIGPTILLPPYPAVHGFDPALMYIDFDDVRDPASGEVSAEVQTLVDRLDSFTEVSSSGEGLHVLVWANLPDDMGEFDENLDGEGSIEMYDHGRFFGGTWEHVDGTPRQINERQVVVDEIIDEYRAEPEPGPEPETSADGGVGDAGHDHDGAGGRIGSGRTSRDNSGRSPYYDVDLTRFAMPTTVVRKQSKNRSGSKGPQGPHPHHGKTTAGKTSTNYHLDPYNNRWHCFAHTSGGGPMEMAAIMAGEMQCRNAATGSLDQLPDDAFLRICLYARDTLAGFTDEIDPPYRALVAIAELIDLDMIDPEQLILGRTTYDLARHVYDNIEHGDIDSLG